MFNIKYNFLVIVQIIVGILNSALLIRTFGVSVNSDAYFLALSIYTVLCLVILMPIEQFMQFYNELKVCSLKKSHEFYNCSLILSFFIGILFFIIFNCGLNIIIKVFTFNIDAQRFIILKQLLWIMTIGAVFYPVNAINERLFNAEMRFSIPYILSIIPTTLVVAAQLILILKNSNNIFYLAYAQSFGMFLIALIGTLYINKTIIRFRWKAKCNDYIKKYVINSIFIQFGNSFWTITIPIIFNNFLVTFPQGYISYFYYAKKIIDIINNFTIGPSKNILRSKISKFIAKKDVDLINKNSSHFILFGSIIFTIAVVIAYFSQGFILTLIAGNKLSQYDLTRIAMLFLSLCPWYFVIFGEYPYVCINTQAKRGKTILIINIIFVVVFAVLLKIFHDFLGIYSIGISAFLAQIINLLNHRYIAKNILQKIKVSAINS